MYTIVTIGSATRDAFFEGLELDYHADDEHIWTHKGICLPLGSKVKASQVTFTTGGAGTNAAVTFARQGFMNATITRVGSDVSGEEIKRELQREGVDTSFVQVDATLPTNYSVILMAKDAERTILVFRGASAALDSKQIALQAFETEWFYLNSLSGNIAILEEVLALKHKKGTKIAWNPGEDDLKKGLEFLRPYLRQVDIFLGNQEEISKLLGVPYEEEEVIFKKIDEIIDGIAIMTKGPKGAILSDGRTVYKAGTFPEKTLVDRTGAGDAFGSGFLAGFIRGGIEEGLRTASANSTSVLEYVGAKAGILRKEELANERWAGLPITKSENPQATHNE